jgi:hypothetical protein
MKRSIIKSKKKSYNLFLERVIPNDKQILRLFKSLEGRSHSISHKEMPKYPSHKKFVQNNPYRVWYLVNLNNIFVADLYVQNDNSIGLNNFENLEVGVIREILSILFIEIAPLKAIPSKRFGKFFFRISADNSILQKKIVSLGYFSSEYTYVPSD